MAISAITAGLHRHLWQRLPRSWRRSALVGATSLLATRPTKHTTPNYPIVVAGALQTASGLGESVRLCYDALKIAGVPVYGVDLSRSLMQPQDSPGFEFVDGRSKEGFGTLILHVNSPLVPLAMWRLGRRIVRCKYVIGYWAWELPQVPSDWSHGIPFVHEIWVPSSFTAEAIKPLALGRPVRVLPHPAALRGPKSAPARPLNDRPFTVLTIFNMASSFARKNPLAAIAAFQKAFGDDLSVRLIVKASNVSAHPPSLRLLRDAIQKSTNVDVIDKTMSAVEIEALYRDSDVLVSLHRSEGFGLTIAEAMLRGLPVVATGWSGNVDFLSSDNGLPIGFRLIPAVDPQGTYHHPEMVWADADVEAAAIALQRIRSDPDLAQRLGQVGAAYATRTWSAQSYSDAVRQHLNL